MSSDQTYKPQRIDELMVAAATEGLSSQESAELHAVLSADAALAAEADAYAMAATAIDMALGKVAIDESLPASLRDKLLADAAQQTPSASDTPTLKLADTGNAPAKPQPQGFAWTDGRAFGWYAAIAATLALCVILLQPNQPGTSSPNPDATPTLAEQYDALADDADTVAASWGFAGGEANDAYANVTGEVIWNSETQTGYMKLNGMPINNPTELQYQLWIVDASRDTTIENTDRVDGGVFDVASTGEVIIPIDAKLLARDAAVFAITAETAGGVVESKGPLQLVAVIEKDAS